MFMIMQKQKTTPTTKSHVNETRVSFASPMSHMALPRITHNVTPIPGYCTHPCPHPRSRTIAYNQRPACTGNCLYTLHAHIRFRGPHPNQLSPAQFAFTNLCIEAACCRGPLLSHTPLPPTNLLSHTRPAVAHTPLP